jgi:transcriptional regulator with XRE-family HTH domain
MHEAKFRLRVLREKADLTQERLAAKTGIRQATISDLETGKSTRISFADLGALAKSLGVRPGDLFE